MSTTYTVYGGELSLFTRKLEAAMKFYGADFVVESKTPANGQHIETRAATHQVPVLLTPENWMIADTTPLLRMLDARFPQRAMFPPGAQGVLVHILEEYFDEWVARVMVHYRWHYPDSARFAAGRMARGNEEVITRMLSWGPRACRATGTDSAHQRQAVEAEYLRILENAEAQLKDTAFLLGDRPTALDCIVLGGLRAHTNMDPDPKKVTAGFPTVVDWVERRADTWDGGSGDDSSSFDYSSTFDYSSSLATLEQPTPFAQHILSEMASTYAPYVLANRDAQAAGAKAFHVDTYGEEVSYLSRPYPEQARQMVVQRIDELADASQRSVRGQLQSLDLAQVFS